MTYQEDVMLNESRSSWRHKCVELINSDQMTLKNETENCWIEGCKILSIEKDVKLADNCKIERSTLFEHDAKAEDPYKKVLCILNKLTPRMFDTLVKQLKDLLTDDRNTLQRIADLVFVKAVNEPSFTALYAQMCKELFSSVEFGNLVVNRCHIEFEKLTAFELNEVAKLKKIENITDPEMKKELKLMYKDEERQMLKNSVGLMRFMGELFKQQSLTTNTMHYCINQLLSEGSEISLECLSTLLTIVDKDLEYMNQDMGVYYDTINEITTLKGALSTRLMYMLKDVIELHKRGWIPKNELKAEEVLTTPCSTIKPNKRRRRKHSKPIIHDQSHKIMDVEEHHPKLYSQNLLQAALKPQAQYENKELNERDELLLQEHFQNNATHSKNAELYLIPQIRRKTNIQQPFAEQIFKESEILDPFQMRVGAVTNMFCGTILSLAKTSGIILCEIHGTKEEVIFFKRSISINNKKLANKVSLDKFLNIGMTVRVTVTPFKGEQKYKATVLEVPEIENASIIPVGIDIYYDGVIETLTDEISGVISFEILGREERAIFLKNSVRMNDCETDSVSLDSLLTVGMPVKLAIQPDIGNFKYKAIVVEVLQKYVTEKPLEENITVGIKNLIPLASCQFFNGTIQTLINNVSGIISFQIGNEYHDAIFFNNSVLISKAELESNVSIKTVLKVEMPVKVMVEPYNGKHECKYKAIVIEVLQESVTENPLEENITVGMKNVIPFASSQFLNGTIQTLTDNVSGIISFQIGNNYHEAIFFKKSILISEKKLEPNVSIKAVLKVGMHVQVLVKPWNINTECKYKAVFVQILHEDFSVKPALPFLDIPRTEEKSLNTSTILTSKIPSTKERELQTCVSKNSLRSDYSSKSFNIIRCKGYTGKVKSYLSSTCGILECVIKDIKLEGTFCKNVVASPDNKIINHLPDLWPVGMMIHFDAEVKDLHGIAEINITSVWKSKRSSQKLGQPCLSDIPRIEVKSLNTSTILTSKIPSTKERELQTCVSKNSLQSDYSSKSFNIIQCKGYTGKVKSYLSSTCGILECVIKDIKLEGTFCKNVVASPDNKKSNRLPDLWPVGLMIHFDAEVKDLHGIAEINITSVWKSKRSSQKIPVKHLPCMLKGTAVFNQGVVYCGTVTETSYYSFVVIITQAEFNISVFVSGQNFRPSRDSMKLPPKHPVTPYIAVGETVYMLIHQGDFKYEFEWFAIDAWKENSTTSDIKQSIGEKVVSNLTKNCSESGILEGKLLLVNHNKGILKDNFHEETVYFNCEDAFLFGVPLENMNLKQLLTSGDILTFMMSAQMDQVSLKASHVWFGSYNGLEDVTQCYKDIISYCKSRSIDRTTTNILTQRLGELRVSNEKNYGQGKLLLNVGREENLTKTNIHLETNTDEHLHSTNAVDNDLFKGNTSSNPFNNNCSETQNIGEQDKGSHPIKTIKEILQENTNYFTTSESTSETELDPSSSSSQQDLVKDCRLTRQCASESNHCDINRELYNRIHFPDSVNTVGQEIIDSATPLLNEGVRQILQTSIVTVLHQHENSETFSRMVAAQTISVFEKSVKHFLNYGVLANGLLSDSVTHLVQGSERDEPSTSVKVPTIRSSINSNLMLQNKILKYRKKMELELNKQNCSTNNKVIHHNNSNFKEEVKISLVEIVQDFLTLQNSGANMLLVDRSQKKMECRGTQTVSTGNVFYINVLSSNN